jgi:hypothetical protein
MGSRSTVALPIGLLALAAMTAGCNNSAGKSGDTGAAPDGRVDEADAGTSADGSGGNPTDSGGVGDSDAAAGVSCSSEKGCSGSLFCELPMPTDGRCGPSFITGACTPRPATCPAGGAAVCGCDGMTYQNDCLRQKAGVPRASAGVCQGWEKGPIGCGALTCGPSQVCVRPGSQCGVRPPCMPAPDGGPCPIGLVSCTDGSLQRGCMINCAPDPYCLDVPASCRGVPSCACLQPSRCSYCLGVSMGRVVECGGAL